MDQKELQEKIALFYSKLPPNAQTLFSSMNWLENLRKISVKYGLNDKQIETLGTETTLVLLGIIHLVEYEEKLTSELGLSTDSTDKMLVEIEDTILRSVRPQLVEAFEANKKSETEEGSQIKPIMDPRFEKLPEEIEKIVEESNYQATLYSIAKEYNLNVTQMGVLEKAVTDLIAGGIEPDKFEDYIENNLRLPVETARKLVNDINEKIFKKIREELIKNTERKISAKSPEMPTFMDVKIPVKEMKNDTAILNKAGIEIVERPEEIGIEIPVKVTIVPVPQKVGTEIKEKETNPLLAQKLSSSFQMGVVKTEHSLDNLTKAAPSAPIAVKTKILNADPYRELPE